MKPIEHFQFCPRCGEPWKGPHHDPAFRCPHCGFVYYFNAAIGAAAFIFDPLQQCLFIRRAREPQKGKLAIPGGFIDPGETAEDGLRREIREEVNLELTSLSYLSSHPNHYHYREVTYPVLDLFFLARTDVPDACMALDGVESYHWLNPSEVDPQEIAFPSIRIALVEVLRRIGPSATGTLK